jgi:hypothetical protein
VAATLHTIYDERPGQSRGRWPSNPDGTAWNSADRYRLFARHPGEFVAIGAPLLTRLRDTMVAATFHKVGGPAGGGYGIIVRDQGPGPRDGVNQQGHYYVLEAGDRGEIGVWRRESDRWVDLVPWTPSEAVRPGGAANELMIRAFGSQLSFIVNGIPVANVADTALADGAVGVFVGGDFNEVVLDRFVVQVPN